MTRREEIVLAFIERLKLIKLKDGFSCDLENRIFDWMGRPLLEEEYPSVIIKDIEDEADSSSFGVCKHNLKLQIIASVANGENTASSLRNLVNDILIVLSKDDEGLPPLEPREYLKSEMGIEEEGIIVGGALIEISVKYITESFRI